MDKVEGHVTSVNQKLCTFVLDGEMKIFACLWSCVNKSTFPKLNTTVGIKCMNDHEDDLFKAFIMCKNCQLSCDNVTTVPSSLLNLIDTYNLRAPDILFINNLYENLDRSMIMFDDVDESDVVLGIVTKLLTVSDMINKSKNCIKRIYYNSYFLCGISKKEIKAEEKPKNDDWVPVLLPIKIEVISKICDKDKTDIKNFKDFYWTFGVHPNHFGDHFVAGYLEVNPKDGLFTLRDNKGYINCVFPENCNVRAFINNFVLIRNYRIFTENYHHANRYVEFMLIDPKDVLVLDSIKPKNKLGIKIYTKICETTKKIPLLDKPQYLIFDVIQKSVIINIDNKSELWLKVNEVNMKNLFIVLGSEFLHVAPFVQTNFRYKLVYYQNLKPLYWYPVHRFDKSKAYFFNSQNELLIQVGRTGGEEKILNCGELEAHLKENSDTCSFVATIAYKKFRDSPHQPYYHVEKNLGPPGNKNHVIHFKNVIAGKEKPIVMYLSNYDYNQNPLGLLPDMKVLVRCATPQSKSYFKSTPITTFHVIEYTPRAPFSTLNLKTMGTAYDFVHAGLANYIPEDVVVYSIFECLVSIKSAELKLYCRACRMRTPCNCNDIKSKFLAVSMCILHSDSFGYANIHIENESVFRQLFRMNEFQFEVFLKAFCCIGEFTYSATKNYQTPRTSEELFIYTLNKLFKESRDQILSFPLALRKFTNSKNQCVWTAFRYPL